MRNVLLIGGTLAAGMAFAAFVGVELVRYTIKVCTEGYN